MPIKDEKPRIEFIKFLSIGEGFSSWFFKISLWLGSRHQLQIPEVKVRLGEGGRLKLEDQNIIPFIATKLGVEADAIAAMISLDIIGIQPVASFTFADEFSRPSAISLNPIPQRFCSSCFKNSLLKKEVPIFDSYWQHEWATHCVIHGTVLKSSKLLDNQNYLANGYDFDMSSQYANWCDRIVSMKKTNTSYEDPSTSTMAVNCLFNCQSQAEKAVTDLGHNCHTEELRHKFFVAFYLLSKRAQIWSIGRDLSLSRQGLACFPTTDYFSSKLVDLISQNQKIKCIEYLAQFISHKAQVFPYLLWDAMKDARASATQLSKKDCGKLFDDPMTFLAWTIRETFNRSFDKAIAEMFPN